SEGPQGVHGGAGAGSPPPAVTVVPPGGSPAFLAPLTVRVLAEAGGPADPGLVDVLERLGVRTLGDLAALPVADVVGRFGAPGRAAHRLARGLDERPPVTAPPPPELTFSAEIDPPAQRIEAAAFLARRLAHDLHARLSAAAAPAPAWSWGPSPSTASPTSGSGAPRAPSPRRPSPTGCAGSSTAGSPPALTAPRVASPACGSHPTRWCRPGAASWPSAPAGRVRSTPSRRATGRCGRWPACRGCWVARPCRSPSGGAAGARATGWGWWRSTPRTWPSPGPQPDPAGSPTPGRGRCPTRRRPRCTP